jgi:hypothetical protein
VTKSYGVIVFFRAFAFAKIVCYLDKALDTESNFYMVFTVMMTGLAADCSPEVKTQSLMIYLTAFKNDLPANYKLQTKLMKNGINVVRELVSNQILTISTESNTFSR